MIKQGSAVMRIVAIAVSIAIVIGFSSVMFQVTARAESVDNVNALDLSAHQLGTLGAYPVIGIPTSGLLADYISTSDESGSMSMRDYFLPFVVFNGDIYYYNRLVYIGYHKSYFDKFPNCALAFYGQCNFSPIYDSLKSGNTSPSKKFDYRYFSFSESGNTLTVTNSEYPSNTWTVTYEFKSASGVTLSSSNVNRILFARVKTCLSTDDTVDVSDLSPYINSSDTYKDIDTDASPSAEFVSCKSAPTGYPEGVLWFEDWIKEGMQYPYFSWYIRDNGNHHSYSVKFSYNKSQVELCDQIFNSKFYEETEKVQNDPLAVFKQSGIMLLSARLKTICDKVNLSSRVLSIVWENLSYIDSFTLNSSDMDFTNCENSGNKVYSVCLSDYSDIGRFFIYKADIIDNVTGQVLDTTYFCPLNKFGKGNSGYGSKIYDYGDNGDGMLDDLINNTPSVDPSIKDSFDLSGDVIDNNYGGGSLSDLNISDIASSLESSVNSVSVFFRFCWTLFPSAIWSIILLGLSLIIILRVLGR